jgi:prephenate dehydratase
MRIAYQGEPGAFSEAAARLVDSRAELVSCRSFEAVFSAAAAGPAHYGVVPIENSIGGTIHRIYDLLLAHHLPVVGEVEVPVVQHLLVRPGVTLERVRRVYSHPQALAQCERFLGTLPGVELIAAYNTAGSAKLIAEQQLDDAAAIASARAGEIFGLVPAASGIQDFEDNVTRFLVVGRRPLPAAVPDKTSIVFSVPNTPGALFRALSVFALRGIDLTKLESRPVPGRRWEYLFYADLAIGRDELACGRALVHLAEIAPMLRTLGSYPSWKAPARPILPDPFEVAS